MQKNSLVRKAALNFGVVAILTMIAATLGFAQAGWVCASFSTGKVA